MKPVGLLLVASLTAGLLAAPEPEETQPVQNGFAKASCDFTLDLLKTVSKDSETNQIISPSSIATLLAILQQGAKENTAAQLEKVLHLSVEDSKSGYGNLIQSLGGEKSNLTLEWGNRAYVVPGFGIEEEFLKNVEENFKATFEELDLKSPVEAAAKINDWVKEATHDYIQDLVDPSLLTPDVVMVMVNAIFFKSIWESPFKKHKTRNEKFQTSPEMKVEVPFMNQDEEFKAGEDKELEIKWVELPFKDKNFSMLFILPNKTDGLNQVIENLSGETLKNIISNKDTRWVKMAIPKFKLTEKLSLESTIKKLGLTDIFTDESNLSGISSSEGAGLKVSNIIHQASVEIDEDGSTAAAATFDIVQTLSFFWSEDELSFRADHPFLFFIVDKVNEIPIFAGKIVNPGSPE